MFINFNFGSPVYEKWLYEIIYYEDPRKTQIMHFNMISDPDTFPWGKSAQPRGLFIFIYSFVAELLCHYNFLKKLLYFSTTYRYLKETYLDQWPGFANGFHIYRKWNNLWQLYICCYKHFEFSISGQKIVIILSIL